MHTSLFTSLLATALSAPLPAQVAAEPAPFPIDPTRVALRLERGDLRLDLRGLVEGAGGSYADHERRSIDRVVRLAAPLGDAERRAAVAALAAQPGVRFATHVRLDAAGKPVYPTPALLVRFRESVPGPAQRRELDALGGLALEERFAGVPGAWRVETALRTGAEVEALAAQLAAVPGVLWAQPDRALTLTWSDECPPSDPHWTGQWALRNIQFPGVDLNALEAWCEETGDTTVWVAVLDSGIEMSHPDISASIGVDYTFDITFDPGAPVNECDNHGTSVAGTFAARHNDLLIAGLAPGCRAASARIASSVVLPGGGCTGEAFSNESWIANGINWAAGVGARATVASFETEVFSAPIEAAYASTRAGGVLHFVAAGNSAESTLPFPASVASTLAIGGFEKDGSHYEYSNWGLGLFCVAPAKDLTLLDRTGSAGYDPRGYHVSEGTSYAAPYAAGVAALVYSVRPSVLDANDVELLMEMSCVDMGSPGYDTVYGHGRPDAYAAVELADDIWVDSSFGGDGTITYPFQTVSAGYAALPTGEVLHVQGGSYDESVVLDRAATVVGENGLVVIGQ